MTSAQPIRRSASTPQQGAIREFLRVPISGFVAWIAARAADTVFAFSPDAETGLVAIFMWIALVGFAALGKWARDRGMGFGNAF